MLTKETNRGEIIMRELLNEYAKNSDKVNMKIFHDVEVVFLGKKYASQLDHIIVTEEAITVIETKCWNGNTFIISQDSNEKGYIEFLKEFLEGSDKMVYHNKIVKNDKIIINVKSSGTVAGELSYDVNFYSKRSMLRQLKAKAMNLREMLDICTPVYSILVFVEDEDNNESPKKVKFIGGNFGDDFSEIVTSRNLLQALDAHYGDNDWVRMGDRFHLTSSKYHSVCSTLIQYSKQSYPAVDEKQLKATYLLASIEDKATIDSIISKYEIKKET